MGHTDFQAQGRSCSLLKERYKRSHTHSNSSSSPHLLTLPQPLADIQKSILVFSTEHFQVTLGSILCTCRMCPEGSWSPMGPTPTSVCTQRGSDCKVCFPLMLVDTFTHSPVLSPFPPLAHRFFHASSSPRTHRERWGERDHYLLPSTVSCARTSANQTRSLGEGDATSAKVVLPTRAGLDDTKAPKDARHERDGRISTESLSSGKGKGPSCGRL